MLLRHLTEDKVPLSSEPKIAGTAFYPQPNNSDTRVTIFFFGLSVKIKLEIKTYRINLIQAIIKLFFFLKIQKLDPCAKLQSTSQREIPGWP